MAAANSNIRANQVILSLSLTTPGSAVVFPCQIGIVIFDSVRNFGSVLLRQSFDFLSQFWLFKINLQRNACSGVQNSAGPAQTRPSKTAITPQAKTFGAGEVVPKMKALIRRSCFALASNSYAFGLA